MLPVNIGDTSLAPQMQSIDPNSIQTQLPQRRGMFGGVSINPGNAIAGFLAGMYPKYADSFLAPMMQRQRIQGEMQAQANLQNMEFQRQLALAQQQAQLRLLYPDGDFATALRQSGVVPGTPEWTQAMQTRVQNELDPAVVTPQGRTLRSHVTGAIKSAIPPPPQVGEVQDGYRFKGGNPADPNAWEAVGGPTPQASGGFR